MMQQVDSKDTENKIVNKIIIDVESLIITFKDNTFIHFEAAEDYDDVIEINEKPLQITHFNNELLIKYNIYTQKELNIFYEQRNTLKAKEEKERRLQLYEQLKKEFEGIEEYYCKKYGEQHKQLIIDALKFIDGEERLWDLKEPINRDEYIKDLISKVTK